MGDRLWRLYYTDGTTYSDADGPWDDAPPRGVAVLVTADPDVGRELDTGDFYVWWPDAPKPWAVDAAGLWDYLIETDHPEAHRRLSDLAFDTLTDAGVKFGRSMANPAFRDVYRRARDDDAFDAKSAWLPGEAAGIVAGLREPGDTIRRG